jgi:putative Mg2+ transporter-C (MgtC) family protein
MEFLPVDLELLAVQLGKLLLAFGLSLPMAWDREQSESSLGVRTFPLVAVGCCAFALVGKVGLDSQPDAMSRVMQGIIAGVGFLGGGAIVKQGVTVRGAATAAAVWNTAALGVAVAAGTYGIAIALALIGFATLRWLGPLKQAAAQRAADEQGPDDDEDGRRRRPRPDPAAEP